jgi:hypothetical protein
MDLCVIAALIEKEELLGQANCQLPLLTGTEGDLTIDRWHPATTVSTQCSFLKVGRKYIITASGGVQIESWQVVQQAEKDAQVLKARELSAPPDSRTWWWN